MRSLILSVRSPGFMICEVSKKILPSRLTATISASSLSASGIWMGLVVLANSTACPFCNMGVITMKMISNTSITSTIGVTLMLEFTLAPSFRTAIAMVPSGLPPNRAGPLQEVIHQFAGRVVHLHVKRLHLAGEVVEHHDGGDGHEQSQSGGHQSFGNTARDRAQTGGFLFGDLAERVQDADDGAQQSDERRRGTDGGQTAKTALQFGVDDGFGALQGTLAGFDLFTGNFRGIAVGLELLQAGCNHLGQMALFVALGYADGFIQLAFAQSA